RRALHSPSLLSDLVIRPGGHGEPCRRAPGAPCNRTPQDHPAASQPSQAVTRPGRPVRLGQQRRATSPQPCSRHSARRAPLGLAASPPVRYPGAGSRRQGDAAMPNASGAQAPARRVRPARTATTTARFARATEPGPLRARLPNLAPAAALLVALAAGLGPAAQPAGAQNTRAADSAQALAAFRSNIAAIHARDRARYLEHYLQSPRLVR